MTSFAIEGRVLDRNLAYVAVRDGRVTFGPVDGPLWRLQPGAIVVPGFEDLHLHLLSMAAERLSADCSSARTILEVLDLVSARARERPDGEWIRATGYDEAFLDERRHPTPEELDRAAPRHPVVLHHRTGHVEVRNSLAVGPAPRQTELARAVEDVSRDLAAAGITSVTDATHENDRERFEFLRALSERGGLRQRLTFMPGVAHLQGFEFGSGDDTCRVGHAKVLGGPLKDAVEEAHGRGFPAAVHALDVDEIEDALGAGLGPGDRIEHAALCLPDQVGQIARSGATVVTQPGFLYHRGSKYRESLSSVEREWLYRVGSLIAAGVPVRASSDAPVTPARPLEIVRALVEHPTRAERVDRLTALRMVTGPALREGAPADLAVVGPPDTVLATYRDGERIDDGQLWLPS